MSEPLVTSLRTCGAVPNLIPASSGSGGFGAFAHGHAASERAKT
jgi:hypothetical protein